MNMDITEYNQPEDTQMILSLMKKPRYNIPEHLRSKILKGVEDILDDNPDPKVFCDAAKVVLEMEKRNVDYLKLIMPKKIEHIHVTQKSTKELMAIVDEVKQMPQIPEHLQ